MGVDVTVAVAERACVVCQVGEGGERQGESLHAASFAACLNVC